jgi:Fur family transcriptional regulator, ferric uptake regulator
MMTFLEQAGKAIRDTGGRMTAQRQLIIELLNNSDNLLDAEALFLLARERDTGVSLATVYRTLNTLEQAGLLKQRYRSKEHERKYYELVHTPEAYHFTCRGCRRVIAFRSDFIEELKHKLETDIGIEVLTACVCFDGYCPDCMKGS